MLNKLRSVVKYIFRPIDLGIKFEVILKIFIVVLFTGILIGVSVYKTIENTLVAKEKDQTAGFINSLKKTNGLSEDTLKKINLPEGDSLWVFTTDSHALYGIGTRPEKLTEKPEMVVVSAGRFFSTFYRVTMTTVSSRMPGKVIYYSHNVSGVNKELNQIKKNILYVLLVNAVILIFLLNFMLKTAVTHPLSRVIKNIQDIENGNRKTLSGQTTREFKYLTNSFNRLLQLTYIQNENLEKKVIELENLNALLLEYRHEMEKFEKLVAVGELSAGIAHEIGNPLNNITGYINLLKEKLYGAGDPELIDFVKRINSDIKRINRIIRGILDYSRKDEALNLQKTTIKDIINSSLELIELKLKNKNIKIKVKLETTPLWVKIDKRKFKQVMLNLLLNAIDGIHGAGEIVITAALANANASSEKTENFIELSIADNGAGINEVLRGRVFDPFFTTKDPGHGTGLGLPVSLRFIREMKGTLTLDSEEGKGTIVTITLPLSD